jgi:hypothetical protein
LWGTARGYPLLQYPRDTKADCEIGYHDQDPLGIEVVNPDLRCLLRRLYAYTMERNSSTGIIITEEFSLGIKKTDNPS